MIAKERYDLAKMLADIDDDIYEQARDLSQLKDIPQDVITNLMLDNLNKKKKTTQSGAADLK
jgi:hypothetical protein